jgi:hypothetical protein
MHRIYAIRIEDTPVYIGWTKQTIEKRLAEHLYNSTYTNKEKELNNAIRGGKKFKDALLSKAVAEGLEVTIHLIQEVPLWEPLDEQYWIDHYRYTLGHTLVNEASGAVWQPKIKLADGTIVDAEKHNAAELKKDIQEFKKRPKVKVKKTPKKKVEKRALNWPKTPKMIEDHARTVWNTAKIVRSRYATFEDYLAFRIGLECSEKV